MSTSRPRAGELLVYIGRAPVPIQRLHLKPLNRQTFSLALPAGALGLVISPEPGLEKVPGRIALRPVLVTASAPLARTARPYGSTNVYFLDDNVFVEKDGFWVHGGRAAAVVLESQSRPRASFALDVQNGRADNLIVFSDGSADRREMLRASEAKTIELASDSVGRLRLTIWSPSGFRPSDDGVSQDSSYLGVWVKPK